MAASDAVVYEIRIQGQIDESWSAWLDGLTVTPQSDGSTLLSGPIIDQAALHGVLDRLYALNLTILSVMQLRSDRALKNESE